MSLMDASVKMKNATEVKSLFEEYLLNLELGEGGTATGLYEPMRYILDLKAKRIRPVLTMLAYQAAGGGDPIEAAGIAAAVELFHNFTLIHDDIMDNADVRRGMPAVHTKWGQNTAILSGDGMYAISMGMLVRDFSAKAGPLVNEFTRICLGVCEGQMEDMSLAESPGGSIPGYLEMIRKKTALLIGGSMALGAIAAGASNDLVQEMKEYGETLGVAFQLQDDYLDAFADQDVFGKKPGGDILENKKTFLLLKAFEIANENDLKQLSNLLETETDNHRKVEGVITLFKQLGIDTLTQEKINATFEKADKMGAKLARLDGFEFISQVLDALTQRQF